MAYTDIDKISAQLGGTSISSSTTPSTDDVNVWITEAKDEIDSRTGNTYEQVTVTNKIFDWDGLDNILRIDAENLDVSVLEYSSESEGETPSWTAKTEDTDFYVYDNEISFTSKFNPIAGKKRFRVTYTYGPSSVPGIIQRLATLIVAQRTVQTVVQQQAFANSGGEVQVGTIKVGNPSAFSVSASVSTANEIKDIFDKVIGSSKFYRIDRVY